MFEFLNEKKLPIIEHTNYTDNSVCVDRLDIHTIYR